MSQTYFLWSYSLSTKINNTRKKSFSSTLKIERVKSISSLKNMLIICYRYIYFCLEHTMLKSFHSNICCFYFHIPMKFSSIKYQIKISEYSVLEIFSSSFITAKTCKTLKSICIWTFIFTIIKSTRSSLKLMISFSVW